MSTTEKQTIKPGYCQCGCGQKTTLVQSSCAKRGYIAGQPNKFVFGHGNKRVPVQSTRREKFWQRADTTNGPSGCWPWRGTRSKGYGQLNIGGRVRKYAHRVAWELFCGPIPDALFVCHHCDNPCCVNPHHLFLGTALDNKRDCVSKDRHVKGDRQWQRRYPERRITGDQHYMRRRPELRLWGDKNPARRIPHLHQGEKNGRAKLTWETVADIRRRYPGDEQHRETLTSLAQEYHVTTTAIYRVIKGLAWVK